MVKENGESEKLVSPLCEMWPGGVVEPVSVVRS